MGHSTATYEQGLSGLNAGATCLTHTLNAMPAFASREAGLAGLVTLPATHKPAPPYYTIIADGQHLHPSTVSLLYRANPKRAITITDSIELASLPDGKLSPGCEVDGHFCALLYFTYIKFGFANLGQYVLSSLS